MTREFILSEIRRVASENDGTVLGRERFAQETGIMSSDVEKHWVRWNDAVQDAGLMPNKLQSKIEREVLIEKLISLVRELGHLPVKNVLRMKAREDSSFPNEKTFARIAGGLGAKLAAMLREYCSEHDNHNDVLGLLPEVSDFGQTTERPDERAGHFGFVYLMKSGRYHKIGRSNHAGRREYELAIQLPEAVKTVHRIQTDDPQGIEKYWHKRFASTQQNGEWFHLDAADVAAFKRRKFM